MEHRVLVTTVCWWQVKLCNPHVTHGRYLSGFETHIFKCYVNSPSVNVHGQTMKEVTASRNVSAEKRFKLGTDSLFNFKIGERYPSVVYVQGH